jgi:hypothetical protein
MKDFFDLVEPPEVLTGKPRKVGLVVGYKKTTEELDRAYGGVKPTCDIEFVQGELSERDNQNEHD